MKNHFKIFGVLFLLTVYCYAISIVAKPHHLIGFKHKTNAAHKELVAAFSEKQFCHTSATENSAHSFNSHNSQGFKKQNGASTTIIKETERNFKVVFSQYTFHSKNILLSLKVAAIIFPFHYFL